MSAANQPQSGRSWGSGKLSFNPLDVMLLLVTVLSTLVMGGLAIVQVYGFSFSEPFVTVSSLPNDPSTAWLISVSALIATVATNDRVSMSGIHAELQTLDRYYYYTVLLSVALTVGWLFVPGLESFVESQDTFGILYTVVVTTSQLVVGYML